MSSTKKWHNNPDARSSKRIKVPLKDSGNGDIRSFFVPFVKKKTMISEQERSYETKMNRNKDKDKEDSLAKKKTMISEQERSYETEMNRIKDEDKEDVNTHTSWVSDMEESFVSEDKTMATDATTSREEWDDEPPNIRVVWKNKDYYLPKPAMLQDQKTILEKMWEKTTILRDTSKNSSKQATLRYEIIPKVVDHLMQNQDDIWNKISTLRSGHSATGSLGVYGISRGPGGSVLKVGMSRNCYARVKQQFRDTTFKGFCFMIADQKRLVELLPSDLIDEVVGLRLPGIQFHGDHDESARDTIAMQLFEAYVASAIDTKVTTCVTNTVLEVLERTVPDDISNLGVKEEDLDKILEFFGKDYPTIVAMGSWTTFKTMVYKRAEDFHQDYIETRLRKEPEGEFCKKYLIKRLCGKSFSDFKDCMDECPFFHDRLKPAIEKLKVELEVPNPEKGPILTILDKITGKNRDPYYRPERAALANAFVSKFEQLITEIDKDTIIMVEKATLLAAKAKEKSWWKKNIDESKAIHLLGDKSYDLTLLTTSNNRRIIVTRSFFLAFSPEVCKWEDRKKTVESMIVFLDLMKRLLRREANQHARAELEGNEQTKTELISYLMDLDFGGDNDLEEDLEEGITNCQARFYLPSGYLIGAMSNTMVLANQIGSGMNIHVHFWIIFELGEDTFRKLLTTLGFKLDKQGLWPSHPRWKCPGIPATANSPEKTCSGYDWATNALMVTESNNSHTSYQYFCCKGCYALVPEHAAARKKKYRNIYNMTNEAMENMRAYNSERTDKNIFPYAKLSVQTKKKLEPYPDWLKTLFQHALIFFLERRCLRTPRGEPYRHTKDSVQRLLRRVLQEYWDEDGFIDGEVMYRIPQLHLAMSEFLERDTSSIFDNWIIKEEVEIVNTYPNYYSVNLDQLYEEVIAFLTKEYGEIATPVENNLKEPPKRILYGTRKSTKSNGKTICHCNHPGCEKQAHLKGLCDEHGERSKKICAHPGCETRAIWTGLCYKHGPKKICKHPGCESIARKKGMCYKHGPKKICKHPGCETSARKKGLCMRHANPNFLNSFKS